MALPIASFKWLCLSVSGDGVTREGAVELVDGILAAMQIEMSFEVGTNKLPKKEK